MTALIIFRKCTRDYLSNSRRALLRNGLHAHFSNELNIDDLDVTPDQAPAGPIETRRREILPLIARDRRQQKLCWRFTRGFPGRYKNQALVGDALGAHQGHPRGKIQRQSIEIHRVAARIIERVLGTDRPPASRFPQPHRRHLWMWRSHRAAVFRSSCRRHRRRRGYCWRQGLPSRRPALRIDCHRRASWPSESAQIDDAAVVRKNRGVHRDGARSQVGLQNRIANHVTVAVNWHKPHSTVRLSPATGGPDHWSTQRRTAGSATSLSVLCHPVEWN